MPGFICAKRKRPSALLRAVRVAPVLTSVAFTVALGTTAPVASLMVPVSALLVPLCARKLFRLTTVNTRKNARDIAVRIRIDNDPPGIENDSLRKRAGRGHRTKGSGKRIFQATQYLGVPKVLGSPKIAKVSNR